MKNRTVLLYMTFVFLSNFSTILYFLTVYLEFVGLSMVSISSMMIAYQVSKFILEVPTGYIADRFGRKTSGLVGVVGMLGYYAALLLVRSPLLLIGAFALKGFAVACVSGSIEAIYIDSVSQDQLVDLMSLSDLFSMPLMPSPLAWAVSFRPSVHISLVFRQISSQWC